MRVVKKYISAWLDWAKKRGKKLSKFVKKLSKRWKKKLSKNCQKVKKVSKKLSHFVKPGKINKKDKEIF
jgi:gas vesicle protein